MLKQIEGSHAVAEAVALCRPEVICAYPITPQTHIVEDLGEMVKKGDLKPCKFINVESEFAALSVAIGASATGARAYTATAAQGLLYMVEAMFNASGLCLPIVMTVANRALGAPVSIWNDHSDALSQSASGWMQFFAEDNQEAIDLHIIAFRLAEELSVPIMVSMDGFILTHAYERVDMPSQAQVDSYLPPFKPALLMDPAAPVSMGVVVGPEAYMEVKYLEHARQLRALERIPQLAAEFKTVFGRDAGGLTRAYRLEDAETVIVAMGSVLGTAKDTVDEMRDVGHKIGVLGIVSFRPFPAAQVREALRNAKRVVILDKSLSVGLSGIMAADVNLALSVLPLKRYTVIIGLGGRTITKNSLRGLFLKAEKNELEETTFLDLKWDVVNRQLADEKTGGPTAAPAAAIPRDKIAAAKRKS